MRTQEAIMEEAGYVSASKAAGAIGCDQVGSVHRMVKKGVLVGARAGKHWYVTIKSLLEAHKDAPPIVARILALGVPAKEHEATLVQQVQKVGRTRIRKGVARARRSA